MSPIRRDRLRLLGCATLCVCLPLIGLVGWMYAAQVIERLLLPPARGPLLAVCGAAAAGYGIWLLWHVMSQHWWPIVIGTIEVSEVQQRERHAPDSSSHGGWNSDGRQWATFYRPVVGYRYAVGDRGYHGEWSDVPYVRGQVVSIGDSPDPVAADQIVARYPVGSQANVYVHPSSPEVSTLAPGRLWGRGAAFFALGVLAIATGTWLW